MVLACASSVATSLFSSLFFFFYQLLSLNSPQAGTALLLVAIRMLKNVNIKRYLSHEYTQSVR